MVPPRQGHCYHRPASLPPRHRATEAASTPSQLLASSSSSKEALLSPPLAFTHARVCVTWAGQARVWETLISR